jgi:cytochrome b pre-mRNA-processing protein 3
MWEAFHGRAAAYEAALAAGDDAALEAALARNVWRGADPPAGSAAVLAARLRAGQAALAAQELAALAAAKVQFPPASRL